MNNTRALAVAIFLTALAIASPARAQSGDTAVAAVNTPVFVAPDASKTPLRVASAGTSFVVLEEAGEWTKVQFQDPQWGRRVGYVVTKDLRVHRAALAPMDLSVKPEAAAPAPPSRSRSPSRCNRLSVANRRSRWPHSTWSRGPAWTFRDADDPARRHRGRLASRASSAGLRRGSTGIATSRQSWVEDLSQLISVLVGDDVNIRFFPAIR